MNSISIFIVSGITATLLFLLSACTDGNEEQVHVVKITAEAGLRQELVADATAESLIRAAPKLPTNVSSGHAAALPKPKATTNLTVERYFDKGTAYYRDQDFESAISQFNEIIKIDPENSQAYGNRGLARSRLGEFESAIEDFSEVISLTPADPKAYFNRGTRYAQIGEYKKAIEDYDAAIKLFPTYAAVYFARGMIHQELGEVEKSESDMEKAIELGYTPPSN